MMIKKIMVYVLMIAIFSIPTTSHGESQATGDISEVMEKMFLGQPVTIVCFGDSVTFGETGDSQAVTPYPAALQQLLRDKYKNKNITVLNKGLDGRRSDVALTDFDSWVTSYHPDLVIIMYGINDASGLTGQTNSVYDFKINLSAMVDKANSNNIKTLLMNPTPTFFSFEYATPEVNKKLLMYDRAVREVADKKNVAFYDLFGSIYNLYYSKAVSNTSANISDGVHFTNSFYQVIADNILYHALDYTDLSNTLLDRGKNDTNIPLVYSPYIETNFTGVNASKSQFYVKNYFVYNDGSTGSYLKFDFYIDSPGMDLVLTSPKTEYGGKVSITDNGINVGSVDFYNNSTIFDVDSVILKNMSIGKHSMLFSIDQLKQGESTKQNYFMYFTAFKFTQTK